MRLVVSMSRGQSSGTHPLKNINDITAHAPGGEHVQGASSGRLIWVLKKNGIDIRIRSSVKISHFRCMAWFIYHMWGSTKYFMKKHIFEKVHKKLENASNMNSQQNFYEEINELCCTWWICFKKHEIHNQWLIYKASKTDFNFILKKKITC